MRVPKTDMKIGMRTLATFDLPRRAARFQHENRAGLTQKLIGSHTLASQT